MLKKINLQPKLIPWLLNNKIFSQEPLKVLDIGARGGLEKHWQVYQEYIEQIGIEPDKKECDRLNRETTTNRCQFYPLALGKKSEKMPFYICQGEGSSSFYPANKEFIKRFEDESSQLMKVRQIIELETTDLDTLCHDQNLGDIDFIKLDVEGSELDILQGGEQCLKKVMGLSLEVLFHSFLRHQPTFSEIDLWLAERGFYLYDLATYRHGRKALPLPSDSYGNTKEGQVLWGQALYLRDGFQELNNNDFSLFGNPSKIFKLASLMELFCLPDCAMELLKIGTNKEIINCDLKVIYDLLKPKNISDNKNNNNYQQNSLTKDFKIIESEIIPDLITTNNWHNIQAITDIMPQALTNFYGFEYRLSSNNSYTDFLLCVGANEAGQKVLGDDSYSIKLPEFLGNIPEWKNLTNFSQSWNNTDSYLFKKVHNIWLEFDIEETVSTIPIPSIFFGLSTTDPEQSFDWVTDIALPLLFNRNLPEKLKDNILKCFDALPQDAYIFQIGFMLARQVEAVRLCIRNIQPQDIIPFLSSMNWLGDTNNLSQLLQELATKVDRIDLDIDVGETIYPKIGLECYLQNQPSLQPKWSLFFDYLVNKSLCTAEKQNKLLNYHGYVRQRERSNTLVSSTSRLNQLLGTKYETVFFKGLNHIKLTYIHQEALEAKAYLYVSRNKINVAEFKARKNEVTHASI